MIPKNDFQPLSRLEVDLDALAHNIQALKSLTPKGSAFTAVVKANAYGHGLLPVARTAIENGADFLAVARISEAVALREAEIDTPILMFGEVRPGQVSYLCSNRIRASLTDMETAGIISAQAQKEKIPLKIHVKVDTGMGRLGFVTENRMEKVARDIIAISNLPGIELEGLYTHLARADEADKTHARSQMDNLAALAEQLHEKGCAPAYVHAANSAGVIDLPDSRFNMVRPGISLYGLWPSAEVDKSRIDLLPVMRITSQIIQIKTVDKGFSVSYGSTHITPEPTRIATIPIGYADGYSRLLSNKGQMLVRGQKARVLGRVCMDFTMIDVGDIPDAALGDEVVVMGSQKDAAITADDIAREINTINYEITAGLTARMPMTYLRSGEPE